MQTKIQMLENKIRELESRIEQLEKNAVSPEAIVRFAAVAVSGDLGLKPLMMNPMSKAIVSPMSQLDYESNIRLCRAVALRQNLL